MAAGRTGHAPARERGQRTQWLVLACGLALTAAATAFVAVSTAGRDDARFDNAVQSAADRIISRLDIYISTLRGSAALFATHEDIDAETFRRYAERLELQRWYPGIQGIGWSARLEANLTGPVDERHAIRYLEPMDARNQAAIGYNMYSEPVRRDAMQRARDHGEPAVSGRVTLVQEIIGPQQPGFLIYVPVYAGGTVPADVQQRRELLLGFAYSPFRANDLFAGIFGMEEHPRVSFAVHDGMMVDSAARLFASERAAGHRPRHRAVSTLRIAGRPWTVEFESQPEFESASMRGLVPMVAIAGLLATFWLFRLAVGQSRARFAAEAASRAKSAFLATMSHELRTPLNAIGGYAELMQLGIVGPTTSQQQNYLHGIQRAQQHLLRLINDVLNFAKLDAGRVEFRPRPIAAAAVVAEAAAMVGGMAEQQGLRFDVAGGPDVMLLGDADKVRQILLNLYSNAVKFTDRGGSVETRWHDGPDTVEIAVTDTGPGIAADRLESIFEPFTQVDSDLTRQRQGTGLGLSISRELARAMGGDVMVDSAPGRGSTFTLVLPRHDDGGSSQRESR